MLLLAGVIVAGGIAFAAWFGVFSGIKITERKFDGGLFFYNDYQGHIKNIGSSFQGICSLRSKLFGQIDGAYPTGIYYDDPNSLVNQNLLRASTGLLIKKSELITPQVEEQFKTLGFKKVLLPAAMSLNGKFPVKIGLSCVLGAMKFYPKLNKLVAESGEKYSGMEDSASIEVIEGGYVHYYFLTDKIKEFKFSPYPRSELKTSATKGPEATQESKKAK
jgi:hypothetical protein